MWESGWEDCQEASTGGTTDKDRELRWWHQAGPAGRHGPAWEPGWRWDTFSQAQTGAGTWSLSRAVMLWLSRDPESTQHGGAGSADSWGQNQERSKYVNNLYKAALNTSSYPSDSNTFIPNRMKCAWCHTLFILLHTIQILCQHFILSPSTNSPYSNSCHQPTQSDGSFCGQEFWGIGCSYTTMGPTHQWAGGWSGGNDVSQGKGWELRQKKI